MMGIKEIIDAEGNLIHICWFEGLHKSLVINSESVVRMQPFNPFDFIIYPLECTELPFKYPDSQKSLLQQALYAEQLSSSLIDYGEQILKESNNNTINFITNSTRKIHADFIVESRAEGKPHTADKTFYLKRGSCRDLSWMQIQLLRHFGIASRFVSGYYFVQSEDNSDFELHAWIEVFIPGAGWIGLDPSNGMFTGNAHIAVSSSTAYENTMPVTGSIRGDADSNLNTNLLIKLIEE